MVDVYTRDLHTDGDPGNLWGWKKMLDSLGNVALLDCMVHLQLIDNISLKEQIFCCNLSIAVQVGIFLWILLWNE